MCFGQFIVECLIGCCVGCLGFCKRIVEICNLFVKRTVSVCNCIGKVGLCLFEILGQLFEGLIDSLVCFLNKVESALALFVGECVKHCVDVADGIDDLFYRAALCKNFVKPFDGVRDFLLVELVGGDGYVVCNRAVLIVVGVSVVFFIEVSVGEVVIVVELIITGVAEDSLLCANTDVGLRAVNKEIFNVNALAYRLYCELGVFHMNVAGVVAVNTLILGENNQFGVIRIRIRTLQLDCGIACGNVELCLFHIHLCTL